MCLKTPPSCFTNRTAEFAVIFLRLWRPRSILVCGTAAEKCNLVRIRLQAEEVPQQACLLSLESLLARRPLVGIWNLDLGRVPSID